MIKSSMPTTPCENPRSEWESASTRPSCISRERSKHEEFWETHDLSEAENLLRENCSSVLEEILETNPNADPWRS